MDELEKAKERRRREETQIAFTNFLIRRDALRACTTRVYGFGSMRRW